MYRIESGILTFFWPEGTGIRENINELFTGVHQAAEQSIRDRDSIRINLPYYDGHGSVEGRANVGGMPPRSDDGVESLNIISSDPYYLIQYKQLSPYYHISIPGLCQLLDGNLLAVSREFGMYINLICNEIFGCTLSRTNFVALPRDLQAYINMPRTASLLSKRPRVPKSIDFTPIYTALFGEKIATVIMKEIK